MECNAKNSEYQRRVPPIYKHHTLCFSSSYLPLCPVLLNYHNCKKTYRFLCLKTKKNIFFFSWVINKSRGEIEIEASFVESSSLKRNQNGRKWLDKQLLGSYTGRGSSLRRCKVVSFAQRARPLQPHSLFRWGSHHWLRWDRSPPFLG